MSHTILLLQPSRRLQSRTYSDFRSIDECMEGVVKIFEDHMRQRNPLLPTITYEISELFEFIDSLADISCLVHHRPTNTYNTYNKEWIKEKIYALMRQVAVNSG